MAYARQLKTIAEGVQTEEQATEYSPHPEMRHGAGIRLQHAGVGRGNGEAFHLMTKLKMDIAN